MAFPVPKTDALGIWITSLYMAIPAMAPSSVYSVNFVLLLTLEYSLSARAVVSFLHLCSPALSKDRGGLSHIYWTLPFHFLFQRKQPAACALAAGPVPASLAQGKHDDLGVDLLCSLSRCLKTVPRPRASVCVFVVSVIAVLTIYCQYLKTGTACTLNSSAVLYSRLGNPH